MMMRVDGSMRVLILRLRHREAIFVENGSTASSRCAGAPRSHRQR
jgi:hypothetical protein